MKFSLKDSILGFILGALFLLLFQRYIFWDQTQRSLYQAYQDTMAQPAGVALKDYFEFEWDNFCIVGAYTPSDQTSIFKYPRAEGVEIPDLNEDGLWALAFIKDGKVFQITKAKDVYEDNTQKCFNHSAKMKLAPLKGNEIPRPRIFFEN